MMNKVKLNRNYVNERRRHKVILRWGYVFFGIIIMMCLGTVYSYSVIRLSIEKTFNIGSTQSGMPYMAALATYAMSMFLTGKFLDRYKPRNFIILGGLLVSIGWILSGFATNIMILTFTYGVIGGAGVGIAYGAPMTVVARWFPEKKGLAVGMVLIGFGLSPLVTAPLARSLVELVGIMNTFRILGISFGIVILLLSLIFKYPTDFDLFNMKIRSQTQKSPINITTSNMMQLKSFKGLYINFIIGTTIGLMLIGKTSTIGTELIGLSPKVVASLMAVFAIFNGLGRPLFGWLTDKISSKKAMILSYSLIIFSASMMLLAESGSILIYIVAFSLFWLNVGGWLAIAPTTTLALYGTQHYSQNYGVVFTAYGVGAITGVITSGILVDLNGHFEFVFYYVILLCAFGLFMTKKITQ
jgi:MFS transporter, OFA family, oxalate/formate antiporter